MAGGRGTRFWPTSRKNNPKQLLNIIGNESMLQMTVNRLKKLKKRKITTLEIGCGFPQISQNLYENSFSVFGTDISENVIKRSRKKFPKMNLETKIIKLK